MLYPMKQCWRHPNHVSVAWDICMLEFSYQVLVAPPLFPPPYPCQYPSNGRLPERLGFWCWGCAYQFCGVAGGYAGYGCCDVAAVLFFVSVGR